MARNQAAAILILLLLAFLMWIFLQHSLFLFEQRLVSAGFPSRNVSDLYPPWFATRELTLHHRNPYSAEITRGIQRGYYGRALEPARADDPVDEQRFAYPLYVVLFLAPFVTLPFSTVQLLFTFFWLAAVLGSAHCWLRLIQPRSSLVFTGGTALSALATVPYMQAIQMQQLSLLTAFLLAASMLAIAKNRLALGGILLASATIKPQLSLPLGAVLMVWCFSDWTSRKRLAISFGVAWAALIAFATVLIPSWPIQFMAAASAYVRYTQATTAMRALIGTTGAFVMISAAAAIVALAIWKVRLEPATSLLKVVALTLAFTCIAIPSLAPHNQVLLLPVYLVLASERRVFMNGSYTARAFFLASWLLLLWPVVTGSALVLTEFAQTHLSVFRSLLERRFLNFDLDRWWSLPFATNPLIPIGVFAALIAMPMERGRVSQG